MSGGFIGRGFCRERGPSNSSVAKFFLEEFCSSQTYVWPLECQIIQNFGHTRENFWKLDVQMCRAENKILVFDASPNFATEPSELAETKG
jgi:hypothetical protein